MPSLNKPVITDGSKVDKDDDFLLVESIELTDDQLYENLAPGGKYPSSTMTSWLSVAFEPIEIDADVVFYEGKDAIVFGPVADGGVPRGALDFHFPQTIADALKKAGSLMVEKKYTEKTMIFPLTEVLPCVFGWGPPRMHWVTLHYDPQTEIATLIDSRPWINSVSYLTDPMKKLLNEGLEPLGHSVKELKCVYQNIQHDDIYCGPWTATNIEALANGMPLAQHTTTSVLLSDDRDGVISHHRNMLLSRENQGVYQRIEMQTICLIEDEDGWTVDENESYDNISKVLDDKPTSVPPATCPEDLESSPVRELTDKSPDSVVDTAIQASEHYLKP